MGDYEIMRMSSICVDGSSVEYNGYVYIIEPKLNSLFRMDIEKKKTEYLMSLNCPKKEELYRDAYLYKNYAWFIPWMAEHILCINLDTLECEYYDIPYKKKSKKDIVYSVFTYFFSSVLVNEKTVFCVPTGIDTALLIDMEQKRIRTYEGIVNVDNENFMFGACNNEWIYMSPYHGKRLLAVNYLTDEIKEYPWEYSCMEYAGMVCCNNKLWFAPNNADNMLTFDLNKMQYEKIPMGNVYQNGFNYMDMFQHGHTLWILPWWSRRILFYDMSTKQWSFKEKDEEICWAYNTELRRIHSVNKIILASCRTGYISIFNEETNVFDNISAMVDFDKITENVNIKTVAKTYSSMDYIDAERYLGLKNYINIITEQY